MSVARLCCLIVAVSLGALWWGPTAFGQTYQTLDVGSIPPHSVVESHKYDAIDLSDLVTTITIPILNKKGPIPFSYALRQQTYLGYIGLDPQLQGFELPNSYGYTSFGGRLLRGIPLFTPFSALTYGLYGSGYPATVTWSGTESGSGGNQCTVYYQFVLTDSDGGAHLFPFSVSGATGYCASQTPGISTGVAVDGSGYSIAVTSSQSSFSVEAYDLAGNVIYVSNPTCSYQTTCATSDPNGNTVYASSPTPKNPTVQTWTDSLGDAVLTSKISYGNLPTDTYSYTDGSSNQATYTVNWSPLTVNDQLNSDSSCDFLGPAVNTLPTSVSLPDGTSFTLAYESNTYHPGTVTGRIGSITLPSGGTVAYAYPSTNCPDGSPAVMTRTTSDGTWTYQHTAPVGCGGTYGNQQTPCTTEPTTTVTDPLGNDTVYTFAMVWGLPSGWPQQTYGPCFENKCTFYLVEKQVYNGSVSPGNLALTEIHCYNGNLTNCTTNLNNLIDLPLTQEDVYTFLPGVADPSHQEVFYNPAGLVTEEKAYDFGASTPTYDKIITYGSYSGGSCTGFSIPMYRVCEVLIKDGSGVTKSDTRNTYDSKGNLLETDDWVSGSNFLKKTYTHNANGSLATSTDVNGTVTQYTEGACNSLFPTQVSVAGMNTYQQWDCNGAAQTSTTDENGNTTTYQHEDPFWRITDVRYPDGGETKYTYNDTASPPNAVVSRALDGSRWITSQADVDGYGRVNETMKTSDPQGTVYTTTVYDALDHVTRAYNPTRCNPPTTNCGESTWGYTSYSYDALGRTKQVTDPDRSTETTAYNGNCATVTDETQKTREACTDGLGRMIQVFEDPAGLNYETDYSYDALGNLLTVTQKGGASSAYWRIRSFTYDGLSRLLSANNPESGIINYTYDLDPNCPTPNSFPGDLVSKFDARLIRTCMQYDGVHHLTQKNFSDGQTPAATYFYSQTSFNGLTTLNGVDRLTGMSDGAGSEAWSYDSMGRVVIDQRTNNSSPSNLTKSTDYVYDVNGDVTKVTYPTGRVVNYTFDGDGRPSTAAEASNGINYAVGTCANGGACYAPQGSLSGLTVGESSSFGGLAIARTYNNRLQPLEFSASSSGGEAMDITYNFVDPSTHGNDGSVYGVTNNLNNARSQEFGYDTLNRLISAGTTSTSGQYCWGYQFPYDAWGNLLAQNAWTPNYNGCTESLMGPVVADAGNHISSFTYDAAGNALADGIYSYTWNGEGEMASGGGVNYAYDGNGNRVSKSNGKLYWYGADGEILAETDASGNPTNEYVFFGGQRIAVLPAGGNPIYYAEDFLGSSRINTTSTGVVCYDADFYPFGGERPYTDTCSQNYKFEGKERDTETQNDDFGARYYTWRSGRWLSSDWSPAPEPIPYADLTNPQTFNLFAMVRDNPESFADLDGHQDEDAEAESAAQYDGEDAEFNAALDRAAARLEADQEAAEAMGRIRNLSSGQDDPLSGMCYAPGNGPGSAETASWSARPGTLGKPDHQQTAEDEFTKILAGGLPDGWTVRREGAIKTEGGYKNSRRGDVVVYDENGKVVRVIQVIRPNKNGEPPAREKRAAEDIQKATGVKPEFVTVRPVKKGDGSSQGSGGFPRGLERFGPEQNIVVINGHFKLLGPNDQEP